MRELKLNFTICEENGKWYIYTDVPNTVGTLLHTSANSRNEVIDSFAELMKNDNIKYWYLMNNIEK